ncbi:tetratricopeptide repeat-containing sensor histidine kinase [Pedobacter sp. SL55]|uniref:tetratricopeptide repeat-containing sensor histidine kinase n=1 Tax=Pedobacter sp. SL55 TaxID=2995161 RepID=UPI002270F5B7|nr:tetratricopeptide repeat-containing sensor histidine kinase [Pedobacter sp. SL55]WAC39359.1 ATP-binding protein [Pedobacter sp. SL55]
MTRLYLLFISLFLLSCSANQQNNKRDKDANPFHDQAYTYRDTQKPDSAFIFFEKAKEIFLQRRDSIGVANCLVNSAIISTNIGDYFGGQELSLEALSYLNEEKKEDYPYLHSNYNNLAIANERLRNYDNAIKFYDLAIKFATDSSSILLYLNNKANAYQGSKQYKNALAIYNRLLQKSKRDKITYAMILSNVAVTKWHLNLGYNPLPELKIALSIRQKEQDLWGLNSSYHYIADYYAKYQPDSALYYAKKMLANAQQLNSADDQLFALQKLIKFSPKPNRDAYFDRYLKLDDSLQTARNLAKNRFALIKFETEKHKADNLVLQKKNTEKTYQIIIITIIAILILATGLFWYKKRQQHIKLIAEKAIKENQLKTSKKVHDVVANGLYRVMIEIENQDEIDKEAILDKIEDMYEKSRDISYDQTPTILIDFHKKVKNLINSFSSPVVTAKINGNTKQLWEKTTAKVQFEIEHILQELMVNMAKHSGATQVSVSFEHNNQEIKIYYKDNGVGIPKSAQFKNGLTNTGNRIKNISGSITFETLTETGLEIKISFPIS